MARSQSSDESDSDDASSNNEERPATRTSQRAGTIADSTAWLAPDQPARRMTDGKYVRPTSRPPVDGYSWNNLRGVWVPGKRLLLEMEAQMNHQQELRKRPPKRRGDPRQPNLGFRKKASSRSSVGDEVEHSNLYPDETQKTPAVSRKASPMPTRSMDDVTRTGSKVACTEQESEDNDSEQIDGEQEEAPDVDDEISTDEEIGATVGDEKDVSPDQQKLPPCEPFIDNPFHCSSAWKEPPPPDYAPDLTLYEKHRCARPAPAGSFACSIKALRQEFRCAICLDYIRNARIVRECLHRFCEQCMEKVLAQVGRRKECPICRVYIPSRRSLAPDPNFDMLIHRILRNLVWSDEEDADDMVSPLHISTSPPSRILNPIQNSELSKGKDLQRQVQLDDSSEVVNASSEAGSSTADLIDVEEATNTDGEGDDIPSLVKLTLVRDKDEKNLDDLRQPFLSISGDAPVKVLKSFLRQKHGFLVNSFEIWSIWQGKPKILADSTTLQSVVADMADDNEEDDDYTPLFYRGLDTLDGVR